MSRRVKGWATFLAMAMLGAGPVLAADDAAVAKDLTAVIALQGLPCGQVVSVKQQGEKDYIASCQDRHRYRVFESPEGRVVVQKQ